MAANLAIVDDCILASMEHAGTIGPERDSRISSEKPLARGVHFACGYLSPYFITDPERMEVAFENAWIFLYEERSVPGKTCFRCLRRLRMSAARCSSSPTMSGEVLATLVVNKLRGLLQVAAVRVPGFGSSAPAFFAKLPRLPCEVHRRRERNATESPANFRPRPGSKDHRL